ncbi:MAG: glycosyltransferase [Epsilonproteobacteria bacterium]|nr:glycosyltransferase [Campylobacterota bacterium]
MKQTSLVSVVIPCYNYGKFLRQAVESVLLQTHKNIEMIIINDGSTDSTDAIAKSLLKNKTIKYITQENTGIVAVRNRGIEEAKGDYIVFLDADDYIDANYIEETLKVALIHKADIVYTDFKKFEASTDTSDFPDYYFEELKNHNYIHMSSLIRKGAIGPIRFDENLSTASHEDWDFFLDLCANGAKAVKCSSCYLHYRIHHSSRNNTQLKRKDHRDYIDVYHYVIKKHIDAGRAPYFEYLAGYVFADWFASIDNDYNKLQAEYDRTKNDLIKVTADYIGIQQSRDYRIGKMSLIPIRKTKKTFSKIREKVNSIQSVVQAYRYDNKYNTELKQFTKLANNKRPARFAVIIHLYYIDNWPLFRKKISLLNKQEFDLYITLPKQNRPFIKTINKDFPKAQCFIVPNRGRDVLPFIKVARTLNSVGYKYILKLHSKKSTHWGGGQDWLESMLERLIPESKRLQKEVFEILEQNNSGIVGPSGVYYPLTVNFPANSAHMSDIVTDLYNKEISQQVLSKDRDSYGFYGGTMFWAKLDAIEPLLNYGASRFEKEAGQIDGTFAHALERMFCIQSEIEGRKMYALDLKSVHQISYKSEDIPEWSELQHKK